MIRLGKETRGRDLRDLDSDGHRFAAMGVQPFGWVGPAQ